jgi:hypothetical protein
MRLWLLTLLVVLSARGSAQEVPLEYRVKAAFLYNFARFVDWPAAMASGPLTICLADRNPFGGALDATLRGERIGGREVVARVITAPSPGCHVLFVPEDASAAPYLRDRQAPTLTVGESDDFIAMGGIVNFVREGGNVRFEIDAMAAERAGLRISSRLLRLARMPNRL